MNAVLGRVGEEAVRGALDRALDAEQRRIDKGHARSQARAVALSADPHWEGPDRLTLDSEALGEPVTVRVAGADSVLGVVHALAEFGQEQSADHLVVLTPLDPSEFGEALLARFLGDEVMRLDDWELLRTELKVTRIDPRLNAGRWRWLADTLRSIRAATPLRVGTGVLKLEQALSIAVSVRFGGQPEERVDSAALLEWTRRPDAVAAFTHLHERERQELCWALEEELGSVPRVVFKLLERGHALDAVPVGLALAELSAAARKGREGDDRSVVRSAQHALIRAQERYFGANRPAEQDLSEFGRACRASLIRLLEGSEEDQADTTIRRAEELLFQLGAEPVAEASSLLDSGLRSRTAELGKQITLALGEPGPADAPSFPLPQDLREVETAWQRMCRHRRYGGRTPQGHRSAAQNAVRLLRRLARSQDERPLGPDTRASVRGWIQSHVDETGWVDRAASAIWHERSDVPAFAQALAELYERVRAWRAQFDAAFAGALEHWDGAHNDDGAPLLIENVLEQFARPLAREQAPLIIVLDGMSVEVALQIAEHINAEGRLTEIAHFPDRKKEQGQANEPRRAGVLATVPSITTCSRASLLTGTLTSGKQDRERSGFAALWAGNGFGGRNAVLYHQRDLDSGAGVHLPTHVRESIDDTTTVVGVVLNTVDDALSRGREADEAEWKPAQIGKLSPLLDAAARTGRPVLLTSDHGHVWDRGFSTKTRTGEAARYRTGRPEGGEVLVTGGRVLHGDGTLVVPYREDIRYTDRKEGYHGGFSAAEMVVPVLAFAPVLDSGTATHGGTGIVPKGWKHLTAAQVEPAWWSQALESTDPPEKDGAVGGAPATGATADTTSERVPKRSKKKRSEREQTLPMFDAVPEPAEPLENERVHTLGTKVTASAVFASSLKRVGQRGPRAEQIIAIIDALAAAGGTRPRLPVAAVSWAGNGPSSHPRAVRFLKMVGKALNVEAYPVLTLTDGDRSVELDISLLQQQFLSEGS
ncbi:BREX-2 system phosphatase PglZ [Nocardiopsis sp. HNM0947]|uniref:BREX-2 system phosphatase PglZ n=1 Tax=Nocardiopsis coralli TaxID=2772213 RepID=A0ABR9P1K0_9ACTN|nr:BREX-2 system phosphatase PglZ [Nocardiopsis coralli]MBE2997690.1 BREX-2 system phosphatase PglZ [Nocardiopsis coralli]